MLISEVIDRIKKFHKYDPSIKEETTRDQVLFGSTSKECTGVAITVWADIEVIKKAHQDGVNFIIVHEALFWNHGDKTAWLEKSNNETYFEKKELLEKYGITVWRDHDHLHSGIPIDNGKYIDGIFYGFAHFMGWENYIVPDDTTEIRFKIPATSLRSVITKIVNTCDLNGARFIGNLESQITDVIIPHHVFGDANTIIEMMNKDNIQLVLPMEIIDYTLTEYIKDSVQLGSNKSMIEVGHFNLEEQGMRYMPEYLESLFNYKLRFTYIQSGDTYKYF